MRKVETGPVPEELPRVEGEQLWTLRDGPSLAMSCLEGLY